LRVAAHGHRCNAKRETGSGGETIASKENPRHSAKYAEDAEEVVNTLRIAQEQSGTTRDVDAARGLAAVLPKEEGETR
jgi:hypothetical protein